MADKLRELIAKLETYDFHCEAGPLRLCADWEALKRAALANPGAGQVQETLSARIWTGRDHINPPYLFLDVVQPRLKSEVWRDGDKVRVIIERFAQPVTAKEKEVRPMARREIIEDSLNRSKQQPGAASGEQTREVPSYTPHTKECSYWTTNECNCKPLAKAGEMGGEWDAQENLADYLLRNKPPTWDYAIVLELARKVAAGRAASGGQRLQGFKFGIEEAAEILDHEIEMREEFDSHMEPLDALAKAIRALSVAPAMLERLAAPAAPELSEEQVRRARYLEKGLHHVPPYYEHVDDETLTENLNTLLRASQAGSQ